MSKNSLIWYSEWIFVVGFGFFLRFRNDTFSLKSCYPTQILFSQKHYLRGRRLAIRYKLIYAKERPFWHDYSFNYASSIIHHPSHWVTITISVEVGQWEVIYHIWACNSFWIYQSKNVFLLLELRHIWTLQLTHGFRQPYTDLAWL